MLGAKISDVAWGPRYIHLGVKFAQDLEAFLFEGISELDIVKVASSSSNCHDVLKEFFLKTNVAFLSCENLVQKSQRFVQVHGCFTISLFSFHVNMSSPDFDEYRLDKT